MRNPYGISRDAWYLAVDGVALESCRKTERLVDDCSRPPVIVTLSEPDGFGAEEGPDAATALGRR